MSDKKSQRNLAKVTYTGLGLAIGLFFGGILGLITGDMIIFPGAGLVLGFATGAALDNRKKDSKP